MLGKPKITSWLAILLVGVLAAGCWEKKNAKQVRWHEYTFQLAVADGGATTSFSWNVTAIHQGVLGASEEEIFQAYGGPFLADMQVEGNTLVLVTTSRQTTGRIELDLQHLSEFIEQPVRYKRFVRKDRNPFYVAPAFIEQAGQQEEAYERQAAQRRQEQKTRQN